MGSEELKDLQKTYSKFKALKRRKQKRGGSTCHVRDGAAPAGCEDGAVDERAAALHRLALLDVPAPVLRPGQHHGLSVTAQICQRAPTYLTHRHCFHGCAAKE